MKNTLLILVATLFALPGAARAQVEMFRGAELWGGYANWSGKDAEGFEAGPQFGIALFADVDEELGLGLEGMVGSFDSANNGTVDEVGFNLLARKAFGHRENTHFYLQGKAGWHRLSVTALGADVLQEGFVIGPEVGVEIPFSANARLVVAAGGSWQRYGDARIFASPFSVDGSSGHAFRYGIRGGIAFGRTP